ncbi:MAG: hypothetical protein II931_04380 [Clostridia bacterium]|nr:hypothetical protein [Clostridia bacterium]
MKCVELAKFNFPDTVEAIGGQAFYGCV